MTVPTPEYLRVLAEDNRDAAAVTRGLTLLQRRNLAAESAPAFTAAADEVDRLRRELTEGLTFTKQYAKDSARDKRQLERDVHRLRAVIENAPHAWDCAQETYDGHDETQPCTCWKAEVL